MVTTTSDSLLTVARMYYVQSETMDAIAHHMHSGHIDLGRWVTLTPDLQSPGVRRRRPRILNDPPPGLHAVFRVGRISRDRNGDAAVLVDVDIRSVHF